MKDPNIRLRTNVVRSATLDADGLPVGKRLGSDEFAERLSYWEFRAYSHANPVEFPLFREHLTALQRESRDAFIREGGSGLWPREKGLRPLPFRRVPNPFTETRGHRGEEFQGRSGRAAPLPNGRLPLGRDGSGPAAAPPEDRQDMTVPVPYPLQRRAETVASRPDTPPGQDQEAVIAAPPGLNTLVIAPPGTGKTDTLIRRICHLVADGSVTNPAGEILVLSFTRAAVREITRRVAESVGGRHGDDLRYVTARTFDSFATSTLLLDRPRAELTGSSYEDRIRLLRSLVPQKLGPRAFESLSGVRHLLVDEVQDLNGPRAEMVLDLMRFLIGNGADVLLLGDPAQSIYEFESGTVSSAEFLARARELLDPLEIRYSEYFRFSEDMRSFAVDARAAMGPDGDEPDGATLLELIDGLGAPALLQDVASSIVSGTTTAILTRNNAEAYQAALWLREHGVRVSLHHGARGDTWPGWIARLVAGFRDETMSRALAERRWERLVLGALMVPGFSEAWRFLDAQGVVRDDALDLRRLSRHVRERSPIPAPGEGPDVTVSTVHLSKGLEFDQVFILQPGNDVEGAPEELRILYVASTRARRRLRLLARDPGVFLRFKRGWKNQRPFHHLVRRKDEALAILLEGTGDLDLDSYVRTADGTEEGGWTARQEVLWTQGHPGASALITSAGARHILRLGRGDDGMPGPSVAWMSREFTDDVRHITDLLGMTMEDFTGLTIETLATESFQDVPDAEDLLGTACLGMVPVVRGFGHTRMKGVADDVGA